MIVFAIFHLSLFIWLVGFSQFLYGAPVNDDIFAYDGIKIPDNCKEDIHKNGLLRIERLPQFNDISPADIKTAYECAQEIHKENWKQLDHLSEDKKSKYTIGIETTLEYIRLIKDTMLKNNFTEELHKVDRQLDTKNDEYQKLHTKYTLISQEYQARLTESINQIGLLLFKDDFIDAKDYDESNLGDMSDTANAVFGYDGNAKNGPWFLVYEDLENIARTTKSNELREMIFHELRDAGDMYDLSNEEILEDLRELYTHEAEKSNHVNIVEKKMETCMVQNIEIANQFLLGVEENLAIKQNDDTEISRAENIKDIYFSQNHVISNLFDLIRKNFEIHITESKSEYQVYAEGMKLYEVHNEFYENVGLFYIDFFDREHLKDAKEAYTQILRYRVKELNIIPLVIISLKTQQKEKFSLREARVLFHEMAHCLQQIFSDKNKIWINYDTLEFPGIFMELFVYEKNYVSQLSSETQKLSPEEYDDYHKHFLASERYNFIDSLQYCITDLNLYAKPQDNCRKIIREVRRKFKFKKTFDRTFRSYMLPEIRYAGTMYTYPLAYFLATDAYKHMHSDSSKVKERALQFRRLVFEMKNVHTLAEAFQQFVGRKEIDVEPFYKFWGIANKKGLQTI